MENATKLCVYAICKNESKFIDRWVESLQGEADCVVVLDTGSTDNSVELLKKYEPFVTVKQYDYKKEKGFFRFDKARNDSMKLIPFDADICVVLDLDQVPRKGWSKIVRDRWDSGVREIYGYIVDHNDDGVELNRWMSRNVHPNDPAWYWENIIHEGIDYHGKDSYKSEFVNDFIIYHYPDNTNKDRSLYRELLEYAVKENPTNAYYGIYLGIELSRRYSKKEAAEAFRRCLRECSFDTEDDLSIKFQCYINFANCTEDTDEALNALYEAEYMGIRSRRLFNTFADIYEKMGQYENAVKKLEQGLVESPTYSNDWKDDACLYNGLIEDRLSLFYYYHLNDPIKAVKYCTDAIQLDPTNERLKTNLKFYIEKVLTDIK